MLLRAVAGFIAFSLLSGSVYVLNDLMDVEADRQHPRKRLRPIASGRLPCRRRVGACCRVLWLAVGALAIVARRPVSRSSLAAYLASNLAYSFWLKHHVILDVFLIANGFVLRAIAGVELVRRVVRRTR